MTQRPINLESIFISTRKLIQQIDECVGKIKEINGIIAEKRYQLQILINHLNSLPNPSPEYQLRHNECIAIERSINYAAERWPDQETILFDLLKQVYQYVDQLTNLIICANLAEWKTNQQVYNGFESQKAQLESQLDSLQNDFKNLTEIIWVIQTWYIKEASHQVQLISQNTCVIDTRPALQSLSEMDKQFVEMLTTLITQSFIIEQQPPQVLKKNMRFTVKIRSLAGSFPEIGLFMSCPQVKLRIINENQANLLLTGQPLTGPTVGKFQNDTAVMKYNVATDQLCAFFKDIRLTQIKRSERRAFESVVDEKFTLYFSSQFTTEKFIFQVWTISVPITVIVHGSQEANAWATIMWDNAFREPDRRTFAVRSAVSWTKLANALNMKFFAATGKQLSQNDLNYLVDKIPQTLYADLNSKQVTWVQFCKETLPGRSFTFWDWFYAIMKLIEEHLKDLWVTGKIYGFVSKEQAKEMLRDCAVGTFLLRFSDSELGGITFAWVAERNGQKIIRMVKPFTSKDLIQRNLIYLLKDLTNLEFLYPDKIKEKEFENCCNFLEQPKRTNGYEHPLIKICFPLDKPNDVSLSPDTKPTDNLNSTVHSPTADVNTGSSTSNELACDNTPATTLDFLPSPVKNVVDFVFQD